MKEVIQHILAMAHSRLQNYAGVPGLQSFLLGAQSEHGAVRMFVASRDQHEHVTPHSHRFDFQCLVLSGEVTNTIFKTASSKHISDVFAQRRIKYLGSPGQYENVDLSCALFTHESRTYAAGESYGMTHDQIHSIKFSRDAVVLFFEGSQMTDITSVLLPVVDESILPTFRVEPWMFKANQEKGHAEPT